MRATFVIIALITVAVTAHSSCLGGLVNIFPRNTELTRNPVIFVEFSEQDYQLYERLNNQSFTLITQEGKSIPLKIWKKNNSHKNLAQVMLKPYIVLPANTSVSFHVRGLGHSSKMTLKFIELVSCRKWNTNGIVDRESPVLQPSVHVTYVDHLDWSSPYQGFECKLKISDENFDNYERSGLEYNTLLVEVQDGSGNRYILPVTNNLLLIFDGTCGSAFDLHKDTSFEFKVRLMDFSRNRSKNTLVLKVDKQA
jgi:hypothetical protein